MGQIFFILLLLPYLQEDRGAQVVIVPELVDFLVSSLRKVVWLSWVVASNMMNT